MSQPEDNLHARGWRQGSVFSAKLLLCVTTLSDTRHVEHDTWVVSSQDCDLFSTHAESEDVVEIRPLYESDGKVPLSVRNRRFPIAEGVYADWRAPKASIRACDLADLLPDLTPNARLRRFFKTWLGRGYDRPAIPSAQVTLARAVADVVTRLRARDVDDHVRDVLMRLRTDDPQYVELYAIVLEDHVVQRDTIQEWINAVAIKVGERGFTVGPRRALLESETSLLLIENSYAADLSDITTKREHD